MQGPNFTSAGPAVLPTSALASQRPKTPAQQPSAPKPGCDLMATCDLRQGRRNSRANNAPTPAAAAKNQQRRIRLFQRQWPKAAIAPMDHHSRSYAKVQHGPDFSTTALRVRQRSAASPATRKPATKGIG